MSAEYAALVATANMLLLTTIIALLVWIISRIREWDRRANGYQKPPSGEHKWTGT